MIKIIYPYIHSKWNEELKYSLRSIEKYFTEPYELWIMGDVPKWLTGYFIHVPIYNKNFKQVNICRLFDLSQSLHEQEDFIWMYDDIYLLNKINTNILKTQWVVEDLNNVKNKGTSNWHKKLFRTSDFLTELGYTTFNFECHTPVVFNVSELLLTFKRFKELETWQMKTAYFNYNKYIDNLQDVSKVKVGRYMFNKNVPLPININDMLFLNHDDGGLTPEIKKFLHDKFPHKCKYER